MEVISTDVDLFDSNERGSHLTPDTVIKNKKRTNLILYTTKYRDGGQKFKQVAETTYKKLRSENQFCDILAIESKQDFIKAFAVIQAAGLTIDKFYFYGHSGMYGIMFGTDKWPEQFSPYEWRNMKLPVDTSTEFYFYACRSGRWFAPFIARTLKVKSFGFYNYTTISKSSSRFVWEGYSYKRPEDLYIISCPGKKSHGIWASLLKYTGFLKADPLLVYEPSLQDENIDTTYDTVAHLYESTFEDINVRKDELNWLENKFTTLRPDTVLDIGCGNGAFLNQLSGFFVKGVGVDLSAGMIQQAKHFRKENSKLNFHQINGPELPFADNSFDVVMSTLAFRYLDWDPCISEILRVLKPGGRFLVLDMVTAPVNRLEYFSFIKCKIKFMWQKITNRRYYKALKKMVTAQDWKKMLSYNPIRSEHEMKWYLESRFKGQKVEIINIGWRSRIIAFDTGKIDLKKVEELSYP